MIDTRERPEVDVVYARLGAALQLIDALHGYADAVFMNPLGSERRAFLGDTPVMHGLTALIQPCVTALANAEMQMAMISTDTPDEMFSDPQLMAGFLSEHFDTTYEDAYTYVSETVGEALGMDFESIAEWIGQEQAALDMVAPDELIN